MVTKWYCYGKDDMGCAYDALSRKDPDGDWVYYEDAEKLEREHAAHKGQQIALEVDGGLWCAGGGRHNRPVGYQRDMEKLNEAALLGWRVLRVTWQDVSSGKADELLARALG